MASILILQVKNTPKLNQFGTIVDQLAANFDFQNIQSNLPFITYFTPTSDTVKLNNLIKNIKSNPDYRACVSKLWFGQLR